MTSTIPNVPRELLERVIKYCVSAPDAIKARNEVRALLSAQSPAGEDGLKRYEVFPYLDDEVAEIDICESDDGSFVKYEDAQAIIDGLRGEVAELRNRAKTAEREAGSALKTYKGLEKVARVVSDNSDQVCGELNVLRQRFDQQAQRIGELEGLLQQSYQQVNSECMDWAKEYERRKEVQAERDSLISMLREFAVGISKWEMPTEQELNGWFDRIDAALSAGKEGE